MTHQAFSMAARIDEVDGMGLQLKAAASSMLPDDRLVAFEIAVIEALTNVVLHATRGDPGAIIEIDLSSASGTVQIEIRDTGLPAPPDLFDGDGRLEQIDAMAESGRGVALILTCADDVKYQSKEGINRLTLRFAGRRPEALA
jgi:serine/threonine-protein kinase RsbW